MPSPTQAARAEKYTVVNRIAVPSKDGEKHFFPGQGVTEPDLGAKACKAFEKNGDIVCEDEGADKAEAA